MSDTINTGSAIDKVQKADGVDHRQHLVLDTSARIQFTVDQQFRVDALAFAAGVAANRLQAIRVGSATDVDVSAEAIVKDARVFYDFLKNGGE